MEQRRAFAQDVMRNFGFAKDAKPKGPVRTTVTDEDKAEMAAILQRMRGE
jgi:hypothetical protein